MLRAYALCMKLTIPPSFRAVLLVPAVLLMAGCGSTNGTALNIDSQDTSTTTPGNSPIAERMGVDGSGTRTHRHTSVVLP